MPLPKIFLDGASLADIEAAQRRGLVEGFVTNPTLMGRAGIPDYRAFAADVLALVGSAPVCFQVLADDLDGIAAQARAISSWGANVVVKVPVMTTSKRSTMPVVRALTAEGIPVNITAVTTLEQVRAVANVVEDRPGCFVSIFAGRIADTGRDPVPLMRDAVDLCVPNPFLEVLWASPREVLNVYQAAECGVHVIALSASLIAKLELFGRDLEEFSRETVQMFYDDACRAGYRLEALPELSG